MGIRGIGWDVMRCSHDVMIFGISWVQVQHLTTSDIGVKVVQAKP